MNRQAINILPFLKRLLVFVAFSCVAYFLLLGVLGQLLPRKALKNLNYRRGGDGHMFTRLAEAKETKSVDILFLGSSHAYRSFDPRLFDSAGYKTFNLGSSAQTPIQTELLLTRYLDRLDPKIVIYEVYPLMFCMDGVESSVDVVANDRNDLLSIKMSLDTRNVRVYNALLFGLFLELVGSNASFKESLRKNHDTYIPGGYVERDLTFFRKLKPEDQHWSFRDDQFQAFERTIKLIRSRGINLLLVQAPVTRSRYMPSANVTFDKRMNAYGKHLDFNRILMLDDSLDFYDVHHLNQKGAITFSKELIKRLEIDYDKKEIHH